MIVSAEGDKIAVQGGFAIKEDLRALGGRWNPSRKAWVYPATPQMAAEIKTTIERLGQVFMPDPRVLNLTRAALTSSDVDPVLTCDIKDLGKFPWKSPKKQWECQTRGFHFAAKRPSAMLAMGMRTGKSATTVGLANHHKSQRVLIIPPHNAMGVWRGAFAEYSVAPYSVLTLEDGSVAKRTEEAAQALRVATARKERLVVVMNMDAVWRPAFADLVMKTEWDLIAADESQRSKDPKGRYSDFLSDLPRRGEHRLALTGTPLPHSPLDIWAQFRFLDPGVYGPSYHQFKMKYAEWGGFDDRKVIEWRNMEEYHRRFHSLAYRVKTEDALDLPKEFPIIKTFKLGKKAQGIYDDLERDFYAKVDAGEITAANALVKLLRLQQLTSGYVTRDDGSVVEIDDGKRRMLSDLIEDVEPPYVVFCRFTADLAMVRAVAEAKGLRYGEVSGRAKDLTDDARYRPDIDLMGIQIQSGGLGIDLSRASSAFYISKGFSLGDFDQSRFRIIHGEKKTPVTYFHIIAEGTVDEAEWKALENRANLVEWVLKYGRTKKD